MGLNKTISTQFGVDVAYWRLLRFSMDFENKKAVCVLVGYKDKAARDSGKNPMTNRQIEITDSNFTGINEDTSQRTQLYNLIKATTEFSGATDVVE